MFGRKRVKKFSQGERWPAGCVLRDAERMYAAAHRVFQKPGRRAIGGRQSGGAECGRE